MYYGPEFVSKAILEWLETAGVETALIDPGKAADVIYAFYTSKGYKMSKDTFAKAIGSVDVDPSFPADLAPYMQAHAESLIRAKRIKTAPDWSKALRPEFMKKAMG